MRTQVLLLAVAQAFFQTASVLMVTISGLVGQQLATDKSFATLPIAMMMVAATVTMIPASFFMKRVGRKWGFLLGALLGCAAGLVAASAILLGIFWLFIIACILMGGYQGFAQYYRFAAVDIASAQFKNQAIAWVMAGGVVAALAGPNIATLTAHYSTLPFVTSYLILTLISLFALLVLSCIRIPPLITSKVEGQTRPLLTIMSQPIFLTALICSTVGYVIMVMIMTATPLAMKAAGHSLGASATVIQWHVLGMFVPSFFTGHLIQRYGTLTIMGVGILLLFIQAVIALCGVGFLYFISGLILLGVGWNFLFIGGTSLLTEAYQPSERAQTQAAHDFLMFALTSLASFAAGSLLNIWGWQILNIATLPFLAIAAFVVLTLYFKRYSATLKQTKDASGI